MIPVQDFARHFTENCGPGVELEGCLLWGANWSDVPVELWVAVDSFCLLVYDHCVAATSFYFNVTNLLCLREHLFLVFVDVNVCHSFMNYNYELMEVYVS